jgi:aminoglycoside 6'-N-acetyltransferase
MNDVIAAEGDLSIRPMRDDPADYARMVAWRNSPHVREWWDPDDPPLTPAAATDEYGPSLRGEDHTTSCIVELAGKPVGFIQYYPWDGEADYLAEVGVSVPAGAWGIDLFIGEPALIGQGIGTRLVRLVSDYLFTEKAAAAVALATESGNARAQAAYVKAGMRTVQEFHDTDTRGGQRVESVLMIRERPGGTAGGR